MFLLASRAAIALGVTLTGALIPSLARAESRLEERPGWSAGIDGYGGFALLAGSERAEAHAVVGVLARFRISYVEVGALFEESDRLDERWRSIGGFAGAFLPYRNWVDFELALGLAMRSHQDPDTRYGPGGYDVSTPALLLRAGFSDRASARLFGVRLGAHVAGTFDLLRPDERWRYDFATGDGPPHFVTGTTRVGGHSVSLAVTAGFDVSR